MDRATPTRNWSLAEDPDWSRERNWEIENSELRVAEVEGIFGQANSLFGR